MPVLERTYRNHLEQTIKAARKVAETASRAAVEQLGVGEASPFAHMSESERVLRRQLRAHGRQRGDVRDPKSEAQRIDHLVEETAYEHWHQMLFARFLAENSLLMYWPSGSKDPIDIPLDTCQELIDEGTEKAKSKWELAARFAARMLPQIFRPDSPALKITLAPEHQQNLESLLAQLPREVFIASDSLGWVYQFWQADKKDEVNASGVKIGANELPSVTQLFTEDYMVDFLLDNTLGAWHAGKVLTTNPELAESAQNEDELRIAAALPGMSWNFLRFIKGQDGKWAPAAGAFNGWPKTAKELKCIDPCMGSGHFVVAMFERLVALRMAEEKLDAKSAVAAVIRDSLFGLEIDPRCTQIGAFSLAFAAWRRVGYCGLPGMNIACSGRAPNMAEKDWVALAGDNDRLKRGMARLHALFKDAPVLGSLINPRANEGDLLEAPFQELQPLLERAIAQETKDDAVHEMAVTAHGLAKAAEILAGQFTVVVTNVPYLGLKKMVESLRDYCEVNYQRSKADLAAVFSERCLDFCETGGSIAVVTPQTITFLGTFVSFRKNLLGKHIVNVLARLGIKAFQAMMYDFTVSMLVVTRSIPSESTTFYALDVSEFMNATQKSENLGKVICRPLTQSEQLKNPDSRITVEDLGTSALLEKIAISPRGLVNGDIDKWLREFWELEQLTDDWRFLQTAVNKTECFGGCHQVIDWSTGGKGMLRPGLGNKAYGKLGVAVSRMAALPSALYLGELYDQNTSVLVPYNKEHLSAIWAYCSAQDFNIAVRKLDQKVGVTPATLLKIPFDLAQWQKEAMEKYPHGLPKPFSSDPTQWLFNGHPKGSDNPLHVAIARLLGYRWPRQTGSSFPDCPAIGPDSLEKLADTDGIVCIPPVRGEASASDRLLDFLVTAYGKEWNAEILTRLLTVCDHAGRPLEGWLRDKFFLQHCKLFHHRPFIWHVWDGLHDGFAALVNYHKLDRKNLEALIYTYLGDWIIRQKSDIKSGVDGAKAKLAAAEELKKNLEVILEGEAPFDIFIRWKAIEKQPIGWEPDINDGVRMNIRPFMTVGVLRFNKKPQINISWDKDRGKDVASAPWFKVLGGERINDHHLSLNDKRSAKEKK